MRSKKAVAVEMDKVGRRIRAPNLGLPRNVVQVFAHDASVGECSYIDQAGLCAIEERRKLIVPLGIYWAVAGNSLYQ